MFQTFNGWQKMQKVSQGACSLFGIVTLWKKWIIMKQKDGYG